MDTRTLTSKSQASRTFILSVFIYLIHFQLPRTFHCILISYIHIAEITTLSKLTLSTLYLQSFYKTRNSNVTMCYSISTTVHRSRKLTIIMLDSPNSNNQLGSETRTISSYSKCTDTRRIQQESSTIGYSSSEKISYKGGKRWMASAIEVSTDHTHSNTSDENEHPRKSNKPRRKQQIGRTTRPAQEMTRRKLWIKLRIRLERVEIRRLTNSHVDREMTA